MKNKIFYFILIAAILVFVEAALSVFLLYRYRAKGEVRDGRSVFSTVVAAEKILAGFGLLPVYDADPKYEFEKESIPSPFFEEDETFGFKAAPAAYSHLYKRRLRGGAKTPWEQLKTKVTINPDSSRWTGREARAGLPNIYVLGDSYVYGSGVSDEQTFAYHVQMTRPETNVKLFAMGDYHLGHAYRRIEILRNEVKDTDIIIIGYADYFDHRNVAAPSWLNARRDYDREEKKDNFYFERKNLKTDVDAGGRINFSLIAAFCEKDEAACQKPEPSAESMTDVSAALINGIAAMTPAKVYVLHFLGDKNNPVFEKLNPKIRVISALPEDFDSFVSDTVEGFDPHPGPYWHYAISGKLIEQLS